MTFNSCSDYAPLENADGPSQHIAENLRLRSQLDEANEEIERLRARLETSESDLLKFRTASNLSQWSSNDDLNGTNQQFNWNPNQKDFTIQLVQVRTLHC
jgi:hypothetical protein